MNCLHRAPRLYRRPYGEGLFHLIERCPECGTQTTPGWVPHSRARDPDALPIDPWMQPDTNPNQIGFGW